MGEKGGINLFCFILNNAINAIDPFGETGTNPGSMAGNAEACRLAAELAAENATGAIGRAAINQLRKASEEFAKKMARQIARELGPKARRKLHDAKIGREERSIQELKETAKELYDEAGKACPRWMSP